jgi:hypothetical protein
MEPSAKSAEIDAFLNILTGSNRRESIEHGYCVTCNADVLVKDRDGRFVPDFRNTISMKEFTISGMCQGCQDSVFGE